MNSHKTITYSIVILCYTYQNVSFTGGPECGQRLSIPFSCVINIKGLELSIALSKYHNIFGRIIVRICKHPIWSDVCNCVFFSSLVLGITSAIWASYWLSVRRMKVWMCVIVLLQNNFRHHVQWDQNTYVEILHSFIWQWMILLQDFGRTWIAISIQLLYTNISVMVW